MKKILGRFKKDNGFTLAELLVVIAIIGILAAFGFVAVITYQRNLKRMEMDDTAREIFVAAQNHLSAAKASGVWDSLYEENKDQKSEDGVPLLGAKMDYEPADYGEALKSYYGSDNTDNDTWENRAQKHDFRYLELGGTIAGTQSRYDQDAIENILPFGAIDGTLYGGGSNTNIYIEYDAKTAIVYGVFYTDNDAGITHDDITTRNANQLRGDDKKNGRRDFTKQYNGATKRDILGYYGGAVSRDEMTGDLINPVLTVRNAESLVLFITDKNYNKPVENAAAGSDGKKPTYESTVELKITGDQSGAEFTKKLSQEKAVEKNDGFSVFSDGNDTDDAQYTIILDSVVRPSGHFANLFSTAGVNRINQKNTKNSDKAKLTGNFIPGENLTITATLTSKHSGYKATATAKTNSLFGSAEAEGNKKLPDAKELEKSGNTGNKNIDAVVSVSNARHLLNLSNYISWVSDDSNKFIAPETVHVTRDIAWRKLESNDPNMGVTDFISALTSTTDGKPVYGYQSALTKQLKSAELSVYLKDGTKTAAAACKYVGIVNPFIQTFEGNDHVLANFDMVNAQNTKVASNCRSGIFADTADYPYYPTTTSFCCRNITLLNPVSQATTAAGALVGAVDSTRQTVTFDNCLVIATSEKGLHISAHNSNQMTYVGGLIGFFGGKNGHSTLTMKNCAVIGSKDQDSISGDFATGGLIGELWNSDNVDIYNCFASTYVDSGSLNQYSNAGGLIGLQDSAAKVNIRGCYAAGRTVNGAYSENINAQKDASDGRLNVRFGRWNGKIYAGGLIGQIEGTGNGNMVTTTIENCYSTASVYAPEGATSYAGSFIGGVGNNDQKSTVTIGTCYTTGLVKGKNTGFIGTVTSHGTVTFEDNKTSYYLRGVNEGELSAQNSNLKGAYYGEKNTPFATENSDRGAYRKCWYKTIDRSTESDPDDSNTVVYDETLASEQPAKPDDVLTFMYKGDYPFQSVTRTVISARVASLLSGTSRKKAAEYRHVGDWPVKEKKKDFVIGSGDKLTFEFDVPSDTQNIIIGIYGHTSKQYRYLGYALKPLQGKDGFYTFGWMSETPMYNGEIPNGYAQKVGNKLHIVINLDDVSIPHSHFNDYCPNLFPGEDISIGYKLGKYEAFNISPTENNTTNSLFNYQKENDETTTAYISSVRHLLNLNPVISGVNVRNKCEGKIQINKAVQQNDLDWNDGSGNAAFMDHIRELNMPYYTNDKTMKVYGLGNSNQIGKEGKFVPIRSTTDMDNQLTIPMIQEYDGGGHTLKNFVIGHIYDNNFNGFFGTVNSSFNVHDVTFENAEVAGGSCTGVLIGNVNEPDSEQLTVKNVNLKGQIKVSGNGSSGPVGAIIGQLSGTSLLSDININFDKDSYITSGGNNVGGVIGISEGKINLSDVVIKGNLICKTTNNKAGGLIGELKNTSQQPSSIKNINISSDTANIDAGQGVAGGLIAEMSGNDFLIENVLVQGKNFNISADRAGGAIGAVSSPNHKVIVNNIGTAVYVKGQYNTGGLIGEIEAGTGSEVSASYTGGHTINGSYPDHTLDFQHLDQGGYNVLQTGDNNGTAGGGLIGEIKGSLSISRCFSTASVYGTTRAGGLIGQIVSASDSINVSDSYSLGLVKGKYSNNLGCFIGQNASGIQKYSFNDCGYLYGINEADKMACADKNKVSGIYSFGYKNIDWQGDEDSEPKSKTTSTNVFDDKLKGNAYPFKDWTDSSWMYTTGDDLKENVRDFYGDWQLPDDTKQDEDGNEAKPSIKSIALVESGKTDPMSEVAGLKGEQANYEAWYVLSDGTLSPLSNSDILTVNSTNDTVVSVKAEKNEITLVYKEEGDAQISLKSDSYSGQISVHVFETDYIAKLTVNPTNISGYQGGSYNLSQINIMATSVTGHSFALSEEDKKLLKWSSSNTDIATISDASLSLLKEGQTEITVSLMSDSAPGLQGKADAKIEVTVQPPKPTYAEVFSIESNVISITYGNKLHSIQTYQWPSARPQGVNGWDTVSVPSGFYYFKENYYYVPSNVSGLWNSIVSDSGPDNFSWVICKINSLDVYHAQDFQNGGGEKIPTNSLYDDGRNLWITRNSGSWMTPPEPSQNQKQDWLKITND